MRKRNTKCKYHIINYQLYAASQRLRISNIILPRIRSRLHDYLPLLSSRVSTVSSNVPKTISLVKEPAGPTATLFHTRLRFRQESPKCLNRRRSRTSDVSNMDTVGNDKNVVEEHPKERLDALSMPELSVDNIEEGFRRTAYW